MAFLELQNVSKGYGFGGNRVEVLRDINLSIAEGEFVAIVGYSGAGKTTLMSLIAGLQRPDAGTVTLRGEEVKEPSPDRAIVFQNYSLLPWLSVFENIALAVDEVFPDWPKEKRRAHIEKYIAMVNLAPARDKKPRELSGGMRQRVSVARALAMNPRILLLDEPLVRARRADPRDVAGRNRAHLGIRPQDRRAHHQRRGRGHFVGRPHHSLERRPARHARPGGGGGHRAPARPQGAESRPALQGNSQAGHQLSARRRRQAENFAHAQTRPAGHRTGGFEPDRNCRSADAPGGRTRKKPKPWRSHERLLASFPT